MTWTVPADPTNQARDAVRFEVGDTNGADPQLQDAEVDYLLASMNGDVVSAAALAAEAIAARYSRQVNKAVGPVRVDYGARAKAYLDLADRLWARVGGRPTILAVPYVGGISISEKERIESNADRVPPAFTRDVLGSTELPAPDRTTDLEEP